MKKSSIIEYSTTLLYSLGREEKKLLFEKSNLNNREIKALSLRFIEGYTSQESAEIIGLSVNGYYKLQKKALFKLYFWITHQQEIANFLSKICKN